MKKLILSTWFIFFGFSINSQKDTLYQKKFLLNNDVKCHYVLFEDLEIYNFYIKNPKHEKREIMWCYLEESDLEYKFSKNLTKHEFWYFPKDSSDMKEFDYIKFPYFQFKTIDCNNYDFEIMIKYKEIAKKKLPKRI